MSKKPTLTTTAEAPVADISLAIAIISLTTECRRRAMPSSAPISHHLALYRYWLAKRAGRAMPARSDIDPAEIPPLLPYLAIVDKVDGQFRYRLVGTVVASELGRDLTGSYVGSYVKLPEHAAAQRALFKRVFTTARPILTEGQYLTTSGAIHNVSRLMLPLADDGATVNMVFFTRIACFSPGARARSDWLKHITGNISDVVEVSDAAELEKRCLEWERQCPE
jgi:hypothetical protein